jgi:hypothetical protein
VSAAGELVIDGAGGPGFATGIASSANGGTGNAGRVSVAAGSISMTGGGEIQTLTRTAGTGGDVAVSALGNVLINGAGGLLPTGILSTAEPGSTGRAGTVALSGQNIAVSGGAIVSSGTAGAGDGGTVEVTARGPLSLTPLPRFRFEQH